MRRNKYGNKPAWAFGLMFRSKKEFEHALYLESEKQAKRIKKWQYEKWYDLSVNGQRVTRICPDFTITMPDGRTCVHEIKGGDATKTEAWRIRMLFFRALYPHIEYKLFDGRPRFKIMNDDFSVKEI